MWRSSFLFKSTYGNECFLCLHVHISPWIWGNGHLGKGNVGNSILKLFIPFVPICEFPFRWLLFQAVHFHFPKKYLISPFSVLSLSVLGISFFPCQTKGNRRLEAQSYMLKPINNHFLTGAPISWSLLQLPFCLCMKQGILIAVIYVLVDRGGDSVCIPE